MSNEVGRYQISEQVADQRLIPTANGIQRAIWLGLRAGPLHSVGQDIQRHRNASLDLGVDRLQRGSLGYWNFM